MFATMIFEEMAEVIVTISNDLEHQRNLMYEAIINKTRFGFYLIVVI